MYIFGELTKTFTAVHSTLLTMNRSNKRVRSDGDEEEEECIYIGGSSEDEADVDEAEAEAEADAEAEAEAEAGEPDKMIRELEHLRSQLKAVEEEMDRARARKSEIKGKIEKMTTDWDRLRRRKEDADQLRAALRDRAFPILFLGEKDICDQVLGGKYVKLCTTFRLEVKFNCGSSRLGLPDIYETSDVKCHCMPSSGDWAISTASTRLGEMCARLLNNETFKRLKLADRTNKNYRYTHTDSESGFTCLIYVDVIIRTRDTACLTNRSPWIPLNIRSVAGLRLLLEDRALIQFANKEAGPVIKDLALVSMANGPDDPIVWHETQRSPLFTRGRNTASFASFAPVSSPGKLLVARREMMAETGSGAHPSIFITNVETMDNGPHTQLFTGLGPEESVQDIEAISDDLIAVCHDEIRGQLVSITVVSIQSAATVATLKIPSRYPGTPMMSYKFPGKASAVLVMCGNDKKYYHIDPMCGAMDLDAFERNRQFIPDYLFGDGCSDILVSRHSKYVVSTKQPVLSDTTGRVFVYDGFEKNPAGHAVIETPCFSKVSPPFKSTCAIVTGTGMTFICIAPGVMLTIFRD